MILCHSSTDLTNQFEIRATAFLADYANEAIERFFRAHIFNGKPDNTFDPKGSATRAEFAAMLMNFLE